MIDFHAFIVVADMDLKFASELEEDCELYIQGAFEKDLRDIADMYDLDPDLDSEQIRQLAIAEGDYNELEMYEVSESDLVDDAIEIPEHGLFSKAEIQAMMNNIDEFEYNDDDEYDEYF